MFPILRGFLIFCKTLKRALPQYQIPQTGAPLVRVRRVRPNPSILGKGFSNPSNLEGERLQKIENQIKMIEKGLIMPIIDSFNMFLIE